MKTSREAHPNLHWALSLLLTVGLVALSPPAAEAAITTWTGSGDWFADTGNWSPAPPNPGDDVVISSGSDVVLTNSTPTLASLTITNATLTTTNWATVIDATNVVVRKDGLITSAGPFGNAPAMTNRVHLVCTDLTIDADGAIDVSGKGYWGATDAPRTAAGPGAGADSNWTPTAGGHGGIGGRAGSGQYGDAAAPERAGSGAGRATSSGGSFGSDGGGIVRIEATGDVTVDGEILANGLDNSTRGSSGAGGSIYVTCERLLGNGLIRADGGRQMNGDGNPASGAGGRVAVHNNPSAQGGPGSSSVSFSAMSGYRSVSYTGDRSGEMGSVYLIDPDLLDGDYLRVAGRLEGPTPFTGGGFTLTGNHWLGIAGGAHATVNGDVIITSDRTRFEIGGSRQWSPLWRADLTGFASTLHITGDLTIQNGSQFKIFAGGTNDLTASGASTLVQVDGTLYHQSSRAILVHSHYTEGYWPEFQVGNLNIAATRAIDANARGWRGASGSTGDGGSSHDWWGWGDGAGRQRQGAGYGGIGYDYLGDPARGGNTYGSTNYPALPGSGGGSGYNTYGGGGNGGGLVRILAGQTITLGENAQILANGADGINIASYIPQRLGGGGSGGGIYLRAQTFHAEAGVQLQAPGGKGARTGYGGGGGRIAVWRVTDTSPNPLVLDPAIHVAGGIGLESNVDKPEWAGDDGTIVFGWLPSPLPIIYNLPPTNVTATSATLKSFLHAAGDPAAVVSVFWGDTDGGSVTSGLWQATNTWVAGAWATTDEPATNVFLPASDKTYYYRFHAENTVGSSEAEESEFFLGGDLWLSADGTAKEYGLIAATVTVHRASGGATNEDAVVAFAIAGTATAGEDYVLGTDGHSVVIPAGETSADIVVQPLADLDDTEGTETVIVTLLPGKYGIGTPSEVTIEIEDMAIIPGLNQTVGAGDWTDGSRWSQWRPPAAGDDVEIRHDMLIDGSSESMNTLTVSNATLTATNWTTVIEAAAITVSSNGTITAAGPFGDAPAIASRVHLVCTDLTVDTDGRIDVMGRGYWGETGSRSAAGPGARSTAGGSYGGLGGQAGSGQYGEPAAPDQPGSGGAYLSSAPGSYGSAGGGAIRIEASGNVTVNGEILADGGAITESGHAGRGYTGSGGSIWIDCTRLLGNGLVRADGGLHMNPDYSGPASGAGGRVAIHNNPAMQGGPGSSAVSFSAMGGYRLIGYTGNASGEMGSVYLIDPDLLDGDYLRVAGRLEGPEPFTGGGFTLTGNHWLGFAAGATATINGDVVVTTDRARFELGGSRHWARLWRTDLDGDATSVHITGDLTIENGAQFKVYAGGTNDLTESGASTLVKVDGTLSHQSSQAIIVGSHHLEGYWPEFQVGSLIVGEGHAISATHRGWRGAWRGTGDDGGSGNDRWGWGDGAGRWRHGAGYGGMGYDYLGDPTRGGNTYGIEDGPVHPGSGGGSGNDNWGGGGNGGGLIRIIAEKAITLDDNAVLVADGQDGVDEHTNIDRVGGGGSGGGIYLYGRTLDAGTGVQLLARGGKGALGVGYGGGGGRIAVWRQRDISAVPLDLDPAVNTAPGVGRSGGTDVPEWSGADGTIVLNWIPPPGTIFMLR